MGFDFRVAAETQDVLGECPYWDLEHGYLWWVDSRAPALRRLVPSSNTVTSWPLPEVTGSFAQRSATQFIVAMTTCIATFDVETGITRPWVNPMPPQKGFRLNEGKCDPKGRFWVASKAEEMVPHGVLYRIDGDGTCHRVLDGFTIVNSLAWSPDGRTMYVADSFLRTIFAYDFHLDDGVPTNRRTFAVSDGMPDGGTVDCEGCLWSADYDAWRVVRYKPNGAIDKVLHVPMQRPTSCAFGGPDLRTLYITTARQRLDSAALLAQPLAGTVLALDAGVSGLPAHRFTG